MATLKDLVAFVISEYPKPDELTRARLTKLLYLADVEWAWRRGEQLTDIQWFWDDYGPFVPDAGGSVKTLEEEEKVKVLADTTPFGKPKHWYEWIAPKPPEDLHLPEEVRDMLKKLISQTWHLSFGLFLQQVYGTAPMKSSEQYQPLDVSGVMKKQRELVLERAREKIHTRYRKDFEALAK